MEGGSNHPSWDHEGWLRMSKRIFLGEGDSCAVHERINVNLAGRWLGKRSLERRNSAWKEYWPLENFM